MIVMEVCTSLITIGISLMFAFVIGYFIAKNIYD